MKEKKFKTEKTGKRKKSIKFKIIICLIIIIILSGGALATKFYFDRQNKDDNMTGQENEEISDDLIVALGDKKQDVKIFNGNDRPIAVMIDNVGKDAWPQSGLGDAYCVYEIIVEGGISRMMALFKGKTTQEIGPVRSSRPYFLDYVLENDALYVHYGYTIQANEDISSLGINNIDGMTVSSAFWRTKNFFAPHNAMTSMVRISEAVVKKGYRTTSTDKGFNYVQNNYNLDTENIANSIKITYSTTHNTSYVYDEETKLYKRSMRNTPHIDRTTKEQYTSKNIIIQYVKNYALNDTREVPDKGYQKLDTIGSGTGYFITNGKYIEIKWSKSSRSEKTKYTDLQGNEIKFNDGVTYIQITPSDQKVEIN